MGTMTKSRKARLRELEKIIHHFCLEEWVKVGLALKEIRDSRLFEEAGYERWEDYCKDECAPKGLTRSHSNRYIQAAELRSRASGSRAPGRGEWTVKSTLPLAAVGEPKRLPAVARAVEKRAAEIADEKGKPELAKRITTPIVREVLEEQGFIKPKPKPNGTQRRKPEQPLLDDKFLEWAAKLDTIAGMIEPISNRDIKRFAEAYPDEAKHLARAIERLEKTLNRAWEQIPEFIE